MNHAEIPSVSPKGQRPVIMLHFALLTVISDILLLTHRITMCYTSLDSRI